VHEQVAACFTGNEAVALLTVEPLGESVFRAVFSLFAKTMRAKRGLLERGGAELGE